MKTERGTPYPIYQGAVTQNSIIKKPAPHEINYDLKKGILKNNPEKKMKKKRRIRWENEVKIEKVKIFKLTDEPNAPEISEEEYDKIQQEILKNPNRAIEDMRDMRSREVNMEKENMNRVREKSNKTKELLIQMIPKIHLFTLTGNFFNFIQNFHLFPMKMT